jgi:hypothetical protein
MSDKRHSKAEGCGYWYQETRGGGIKSTVINDFNGSTVLQCPIP